MSEHHSPARKLAFVLTTLLVLCSTLLLGQVIKGSISGSVVDPQGAVLPGAQVKATNMATGVVLTTTTNGAGLFSFNLIPAGEYKVEVSAPGFRSAVQNNIVVAAGRDSAIGAVPLTVGEISTEVEVTAAPPLIETTQSQITNTFSGAQLTTFAGINENEGLDNLALFVPGVVAARDNGFSNTNGGSGFSVNGLRGRNNDQQIDGQNNNDNSVGGPGLFVTDNEFVQQYVLITNQFGPEYGRNAGSVVNVITKSGGNAWHGSIYANENNTVMNSMTNFQRRFDTDANGNPLTSIPRANDEFGGFTVGGPIVKNKAFLFGGFDEEIISQRTLYATGGLTPTPQGLATLAACFPNSQSLHALQTFGPYGVSAGNPTPIGDLVNLSAACPTATFAGVERILPTNTHNFNWIIRADYQLANDMIMGRYIFNRGNAFNIDGGDAAGGYPINVPALSQAVLLGDTHTFTSRLVNEARLSFGRLNVQFGTNTLGNVPGIGQVDQAITRATFNDSTLLPFGLNGGFPQGRIVNTWQVQDNLNWVAGKHTIKAGVNFTYQRSPNVFLPNLNGTFRFSNWDAFFNNTPNRLRVAEGDPSLDFREHDTFLYGGDDWKIRQNLTLNLGLTWSYYGQPANLFNSLTTTRESNPATAFWNPAVPLPFRTSPALSSIKNSFGPSLGFAYSPQWGGFFTGKGKTTIRGGYRLLYDPPFYNIYLNIANSAPVVFLQTFNKALGNLTPNMILPAVPFGPNVRAEVAAQLQPGVFDPRTNVETTVSNNFGPDRVHTWNFGIERELTKNSAVEVRYIGNHATDLFQTVNGNPIVANNPFAPAGVQPCTASSIILAPGQSDPALGRANCNQGIVTERNNGGYSNYNGVQTEFRANNLFKQLSLRAGYTYSRNLDNVSEIFSTTAGGNTVAFAQNPWNTGGGEYSFSGLDIPHQVSLLMTEEVPLMKAQHGVVGHILGGWTFSGNYVWASGQRYTPVQFGAEAAVSQSALGNDPYDLNWILNVAGTDLARPFVGSLNAPASSVGIFAGDACAFFATDATAAACTMNPTTLLSFNAANATGAGVTLDSANNPIPAVTVNNSQVRYIMNAATAQSVFGTPFGARRNLSQDAPYNVFNFALLKNFKVAEHRSFEFRATLLNALNNSFFRSIDPVLEDAGLTPAPFTGFGDPSVTDNAPSGALGNRIIKVGLTFRF
jgi:Carboxypeptidase regulatory-like domain